MYSCMKDFFKIRQNLKEEFCIEKIKALIFLESILVIEKVEKLQFNMGSVRQSQYLKI